MVKTLQPLLLLRVRRVLISKAKLLDTTSWSVAAGTFSCDQLNHFFCSFIVLNFCDIEWTEQFGLFFRWIAAVVSHFQTSNFHHLSQAVLGSPTKPESAKSNRLKTSVRLSICVHTHNVYTIACTCSFSIFASARILLAKMHAHAKRLEQAVIFLEFSYAWKFQNGNATVALLHIVCLSGPPAAFVSSIVTIPHHRAALSTVRPPAHFECVDVQSPRRHFLTII